MYSNSHRADGCSGPHVTDAVVEPLRPGFTSHKTPIAIPYVHRWHRDALIQLTLMEDILEISREEQVPVRPGGELALALKTNNGTVALRLSEGREIEDEVLDGAEGLPIVSLKRSQVYREPICSTARMVWATRLTRISVGDRMRILRATSNGGVALGDLDHLVSDRSIDPFSAIGRLICEGALSIPLDKPISPETMVRRIGGNLPRDGRDFGMLPPP